MDMTVIPLQEYYLITYVNNNICYYDESRIILRGCRAFSKYESPAKQASESRPPCKQNRAGGREKKKILGCWPVALPPANTPNPDFEKALCEAVFPRLHL
jgi:hypothetical protein